MSHKTAMIVLAAILASGQFAVSAERSQRVAKDLLVLYSFDGPATEVVRDRSGVGEPLDLRIDKRQGLDWRGDRLLVNSAAGISSAGPARKVIAAVKQSGELTVEAWIKPSEIRQTGPARIVSLSSDTGQRIVTLGQDGAKFDVRLRTTKTSANGIPSVATPDEAVKTELTHLVYCRDKTGTVRI